MIVSRLPLSSFRRCHHASGNSRIQYFVASRNATRRRPVTMSNKGLDLRSIGDLPDRCFSTSVGPADRLSFSVSSLGLDRNFISPVLASVRQLPEFDEAWNTFPSSASIEDLNRAADVFASFDKGGREHAAVCAMLAECQQRLALYSEALETLDDLGQFCQTQNIPNSAEDVLLAKAKIFWTKGDFARAQGLCESIISEYNDFDEDFPTTNLHMASAMSGKALSQLASMTTLDDAYSVRDYFRIAIKFLERHPSTANSLPQAVAHSNCGVAEAVYSIFLEETNDVSVPIDGALRTWFQGLQQTERDRPEAEFGPHLSAASKLLQGNIQANLAWGVLNYETDRSDYLKKASDYASKALKVYDSDGTLGKEGMCRILSIVASCYQEAENAVTAEGLFQSAINRKELPPGPLSLLCLKEAVLSYEKLCRNWDKREGDAKRLEAEAEEIDESLPDPWKGKSGIHGSLWFWTPGDFL